MRNLLVMIGILSATLVAQAYETCDAPNLDEIVKIPDGRILRTTQDLAINFCGGYLPSACQLAKDAEKHGAKGILGHDGDGIQNIPAQYYDGAYFGSSAHFFYDSRGYKAPAGDLGKECFWSTSVNEYSYKDGHGIKSGFFFIGSAGYFSESRNQLCAVRCVKH